MKLRFLVSILCTVLFSLANGDQTLISDNQSLSHGELQLAGSEQIPTSASELSSSANRINSPLPPLMEHAPLAMFSLGSLAVGGVFYAIQRTSEKQNPDYTGADRFPGANAMVAAGLTAALAAGSYVYFTRESAAKARDWDAEVSGGISPEGEAGISALITLPLSYLTP